MKIKIPSALAYAIIGFVAAIAEYVILTSVQF